MAAPGMQGKHHKSSYSSYQPHSHGAAKHQQPNAAAMSLNQIQMANNQTVNSWFI